MIFLDNASTTQAFPEVIEIAEKYLINDFYNPSATYLPAMQIKKDIELSRQAIAQMLHADKSEINFCSCATEANNWVINSAFKNKRGNIIISEGEHASVYETAKNLLNKGLDVRFAKLNSDGTVNVDDLLSKIDESTCLVSVIHVSNETGVINDIKSICNKVKKINPKVLVHSDGVQAFCKINTDLKNLGVDMYSISGHKFGAPKGIGVLFIKKGVNLATFVTGGGQEGGKRSGTENVFGIVSMAVAAKKYAELSKSSGNSTFDYLVEKTKKIADSKIVGNTINNSKSILAVSFLGCKAEILQSMLCEKGVLVGRGSACSSRHAGNRVLSAMGEQQNVIEGTLRISISPQTTMEEIDLVMAELESAIIKLRGKKIG